MIPNLLNVLLNIYNIISLEWKGAQGKDHVSVRSWHRRHSFRCFRPLFNQSCSKLTSVGADGSWSYLKPQPVGSSQRQPQSSETGRPPQVWIILEWVTVTVWKPLWKRKPWWPLCKGITAWLITAVRVPHDILMDRPSLGQVVELTQIQLSWCKSLK